MSYVCEKCEVLALLELVRNRQVWVVDIYVAPLDCDVVETEGNARVVVEQEGGVRSVGVDADLDHGLLRLRQNLRTK